MKGDFTRDTFRQEKHYSRVLKQQGRVSLDADWNEAIEILTYRGRTARRDIIGTCCAPENNAGFEITVIGNNLRIGQGHYYVNGILCENETDHLFTAQDVFPDAELPPPQEVDPDGEPGDPTGLYLAHLDVWERHITALEDPDIREVALGGPDTATRTQVVAQVKLVRVNDDAVCSDFGPGWQPEGVASTGQLEARSQPSDEEPRPCIVPSGAGYRRLENQLYRVETHTPGAIDTATFKWSRENGAVVTEWIAQDGNVLTVSSSGRDENLGFAAGNWIELTDDTRELQGRPGVLAQLTDVQGTQLTIDSENINDLDNPGATSVNFDDFASTRKIRRWDSQDSTGALTVRIPDENDGFIELEGGIEARFGPDGGEFQTGDYWLIPARTNTGDVLWPTDEGTNLPVAQPRHGIEHHYCPLALLRLDDDGWTRVHDCRCLFPPLSDSDLPTDQRQGCCTVVVRPGEDIQAAIDLLPAQGGRICLLLGEYRENIRIVNRRNIAVTGCGSQSRLISQPPTDDVSDAAPVIHIENSRGISIDSLAVEAHTTGIGILVDGQPADPNEPSRLVVQNIELSGLDIRAAFASGIEIRTGKELIIRDCLITMRDVPGDWPGIFLVGEDALVERNVITVESADASASGRILPINAGRGGLQIGGTSERVRVSDNLIQRGVGDGITLGSLEEVDEDSRIISPFIAWSIGVGDPCDLCSAPSTRIPPRFRIEEEEETPGYRSAGSLSDIHILNNRIYNMGRNGVGVAGFFDLSELDEFISIDRLTINDNEIRGCLNKPLIDIDENMIDLMGYGGIALADVNYLVIKNNIIEDNGRDHLEPVCGIFILHGEGCDITGNRILNNGGKTAEGIENAKRGLRGGIHIVYAVPPTVNIGPQSNIAVEQSLPRQNGVPAAKIHDNIVSQPLGRALSLGALGPVSVVNNQLTSRGVLAFTEPLAPSSIAATVLIVNLGVSNELYGQVLGFSSFAGREVLTNAPGSVNIEDESVTLTQEGLDDLRAGRYLANGNVLFASNQCVLDLLDQEMGQAISSVAILSLDDIGVHGNQCDCSLITGFLMFPNYFLSPSLRVSDNRFKEGIINALVSAVTFGLMNSTTGNQATHCLVVVGPPSRKVDSGNKVLLDTILPLLPEQQVCVRINRAIGDLTGLGDWI